MVEGRNGRGADLAPTGPAPRVSSVGRLPRVAKGGLPFSIPFSDFEECYWSTSMKERSPKLR